MDVKTIAIIEDCVQGSQDGRLRFPDVLRALAGAGVERYDVDLQRAETTYYLPNGESRVVAGKHLDMRPGRDFSAQGVEAAIRAVQAGEFGYLKFCGAIAAAGCIGYTVSLAGRRAVYYGRTAESLVEPFPA